MISDWGKACRDMLKNKGGYTEHPDSKDEIYNGIARSRWQKWKGWSIIDEYKKRGWTTTVDINQAAFTDKRLPPLVTTFYKQRFWDKIHGDELPKRLARKLFFISVDMLPSNSILFLQQALNSIHMQRNMADEILLFEIITENGIYNKKTDTAIKSVFTEYGIDSGQDRLIDWMCQYQAERYHAIVTKNPKQRKFLQNRLKQAAYKGA